MGCCVLLCTVLCLFPCVVLLCGVVFPVYRVLSCVVFFVCTICWYELHGHIIFATCPLLRSRAIENATLQANTIGANEYCSLSECATICYVLIPMSRAYCECSLCGYALYTFVTCCFHVVYFGRLSRKHIPCGNKLRTKRCLRRNRNKNSSK